MVGGRRVLKSDSLGKEAVAEPPRAGPDAVKSSA